VVTTSRNGEEDASSEIWFLLGKLGDRNAFIEKTGISGIIVARTKLDPFFVIKGLKNLLRKDPSEFRYTSRVIPIEHVVRTDLKEISEVAWYLSNKIDPNESYRVTVEKRHTSLSTFTIIDNAASKIDREVNLSNPDKVILIEILGRLSGLSVIEPNDILSILKETKRC